MTACVLEKLGNGHLAPNDEHAFNYLKKIRAGDVVTCEIRRPRNIKFFRKWWALAHIAYDWWEPVELETKWENIKPQKDFDRFRKDLTILAGHFDCFYRIDGSYKIEAKSLSFASMSEDEFEALYSKTIDVILEHIASKDMDEDELRLLVDQTLEFA